MPYNNIQQLSDAVDELKAAGDTAQTKFATFLISQVEPLSVRVAALEAQAKVLQSEIDTLKGTPSKP